MFESVEFEAPAFCWEDFTDEEFDAWLAASPHLRRHFESDDRVPVLDPVTEAWLKDQPPADHEPSYSEPDLLLFQREPDSFTDAEALTRLVEVEGAIAGLHAQRARLVALVAANRPAAADRPAGKPGAKAASTADADAQTDTDTQTDADTPTDVGVVSEVLDVSEWLAHELQMAHPYSLPAAQDLVETSLVLTGRLSPTLALLAAGRIDYRRAQILADLLGPCSPEVAWNVQAMVLPRAPGLSPGGLMTAVRRALATVDAAALRRRHARARKAATVGYYPTADGMARLFADLPLPVAAACCAAVDSYAFAQHHDGDIRPIGQIRTEILTDLILRPGTPAAPLSPPKSPCT